MYLWLVSHRMIENVFTVFNEFFLWTHQQIWDSSKLNATVWLNPKMFPLLHSKENYFRFWLFITRWKFQRKFPRFSSNKAIVINLTCNMDDCIWSGILYCQSRERFYFKRFISTRIISWRSVYLFVIENLLCISWDLFHCESLFVCNAHCASTSFDKSNENQHKLWTWFFLLRIHRKINCSIV